MGESSSWRANRDPFRRMPRFLPVAYRSLLIVSVLIVVALLVYALYENLRSADQSNAMVEHTYAVLLQSDRVAIDLREAELGQLRYVITGVEERLVIYDAALKDLPLAQAEFRRLTVDSPRQQERSKQLEELLKVRLATLEKRIRVRRERGQAAALALITSEVGSSSSPQIRALLSQLTQEEQRLLRQRKQIADHRFQRTWQLLAVGSVILLALLICINYILERDVALRRRAEEEVRGSEILFRGMFDNASVGIALLSASAAFELVNARFCEITGYTKEQLLERRFPFIAWPDDSPRFDPFVQVSDLELPIYSDKLRCRRGDGSATWVKLTASSLPARDGAPRRFISIIEDIDVQLKAEEAAEEANAALRRSNESLQQFAYVASHDLQEPLRTISMFSQLLLREQKTELDERSAKFLTIISDGAKRMSQLIEALLSYSQASSDDKQNFQNVELDELLKDTLESLRARIDEEKAVVDSGPLPMIYGDPVRLHQVFQNLIGNALKYRRADAAPQISISCERLAAEWMFRISDNGLGFAPQYAERIFGIFKRLYGNEISGTGVGLAVVKTVVQGHGGRVWAESKGENEGAAFCFTIPIVR